MTKLERIFVSSRSASLEIDSELAYQQNENYQIYVNDEFVREDSLNVIHVFDLKPNTKYQIRLEGSVSAKCDFTTEVENLRLNVRDFGAKGDGKSDDTQAIQAALYTCPKDSTVYIPAGIYYFQSLYFKSHTRLELAKDAVLLANPTREGRAILPGLIRNFSDHSKYYIGSWEGNPLDCFAAMFTLIDVEDAKIFGEGTLSSQGSKDGWWAQPKEKNQAWRPRSIFMRRCKNISLQGILVENSPSWTIHPLDSEDLGFYGVRLQNPWDSPNTDGIDPESCKNVDIIGCHFSLGDDCIAIKSGKIYMAEHGASPSENIYIRNCYMENGHGAVTIGSEMAGGVKNVLVEKCIFKDTDRGLRIKTRRGRGERAVIDKVHFRNIAMDGVYTPFVVNMFYFCDPDGHSEYVQSKEAVDGPKSALPRIGRLRFENIEAKNTSVAAIVAYGLPEQKIESLEMENVRVEVLATSERIDFRPAMMDNSEWKKTDIAFIKNVKHLKCDHVQILSDASDEVVLEAIDQVDGEIVHDKVVRG